jgi:hypothetical protein
MEPGQPEGQAADGLGEEISAAPNPFHLLAADRRTVAPVERAVRSNRQQQKNKKMLVLPEHSEARERRRRYLSEAGQRGPPSPAIQEHLHGRCGCRSQCSSALADKSAVTLGYGAIQANHDPLPQ